MQPLQVGQGAWLCSIKLGEYKLNNMRIGFWGYLIATLVALGCLVVSGLQAAAFFNNSIESTYDKVIMIGGPVVVLIGSQVVARFIARGDAHPIAIGFMVLTCICAEGASIYTSAVSFNGNLKTAEREQNINSDEQRRANQTLALYDEEIASIKARRDKMPDNYITARARASDKITALMAKREAAANNANSINVSTAGQSMKDAEEKTGVSQSDIALVFGLLMSMMVFSVNLGIGSSFKQEEVNETGKKPATVTPIRKVS